jgi:N,N-dimethylformamidase
MIEGYSTTAIPMSAAPGDEIKFHVHSDTPYSVQYTRLHNLRDQFWAETVGAPFRRDPNPQIQPGEKPWQGYGWGSDFSTVVPSEWTSGFYAAYCRADDGGDYYIPFIVKPSSMQNDRYRRFAMLASVITWNAYNDRDGRYQYDGQNEELTLSFERPFPLLRPCAPYYEDDTKPTRHTLRADLWIASWLQDRNYQVDIFSDLDFHVGTFDPGEYAGLILGTHPEYWTVAMRDRLDNFLHAGGNLIYLGGNGLYERVEFSPGDLTAMRVSGCGNGPPGPRWLFRHDGRSERAVLGVAYQDYGGPGTGYRTRAADHRFFAGTAVAGKFDEPFGEDGFSGTAGDGADGHACGWEMDTSTTTDDGGAAPSCTLVLASNAGPPTQTAHMTVREDCQTGSLVYSVGSICYSGSLGKGDEVLAGILVNVLGECQLIALLRHERAILRWLLQIALAWPPTLVPPAPPEGPDWKAMHGMLEVGPLGANPGSLAGLLGRAVHLATRTRIDSTMSLINRAASPHRER